MALTRRRYLEKMGAAAGISLLSSGPGGGDDSYFGRRPSPQRFDRVIDMVDDAGCDPTGEVACDGHLQRMAEDDTLLVFPKGTYRFDTVNRLLEFDNIGLVGRGETKFVAPPHHHGDWLVVDRGQGLVFENIDIDVRAVNSAPSIQLGVTDGLFVRDVTVIGRGTRKGSSPGRNVGNVPVGNAFLPMVRSPKGHGRVERFIAKHGGRIGTYNEGKGRVGIFVGRSHRGRLQLVDCQLAEFPNNGVYASRTHGDVQVIGGHFANNDISQIRLGGEGSYVSDAQVTVNTNRAGPPNRPGDYLNPRGIRLEGGSLDIAGAEVRNSTIRMVTNPNSAAIAIAKSGGRFSICGTDIEIASKDGPGIVAKPPTGGSHPPPPKPHHGVIKRTSITGRASGGYAVLIADRPGTRIQNSTIDQPNGMRDGIRLIRSPDSEIIGSSIRVGQYPLLVALSNDTRSVACQVRLIEPRSIESTGNPGTDIERIDRSPSVGRTYFCIQHPETRSPDGAASPVLIVSEVRENELYGRVL